MFASLNIREFRHLWLAMLLSLFGSWIQSVAQSWLVYDLTRSPFLLGVCGFLSYLPVSLISIPAGIITDRVAKRTLLIWTQSCFFVLALLLALLIQKEMVQVWHIFLIALANGVVLSFDAPARQAMVIELVGRQNLNNAVALNSAAFNMARLIGPALAGILIAWVGMADCFFINAWSYLPVLLVLFFAVRPRAVVRESAIKFSAEIRQTLDLICRDKLLTMLLSWVGTVSVFGVSYTILMPVFARDILGSGAKGLAFLMSANGLGALIGALSLARAKSQSEIDLKALKQMLVIFFAAVAAFALSRWIVASAACLVVAGYAGSRSMSLTNAFLQLYASDRERGRVMGMFMMMFAGVLPFGHLLAGGLSRIVGVPSVVIAGAGTSLILLSFFERKHRRFVNFS